MERHKGKVFIEGEPNKGALRKIILSHIKI